MTRSLLVRASACTAALVLALAAGTALAQDDDDSDDGAAQPIVVDINGPCQVSVDKAALACRGVSYMAFPSNHRIDFTAITDSEGWAFSGEEDEIEDGHYTLTLDSVLIPASGRLDAEGRCDMQMADDGRTVKSLECRARTDDGELILKASGVVAVDDQDDGDDDDDSAPDQGRS